MIVTDVKAEIARSGELLDRFAPRLDPEDAAILRKDVLDLQDALSALVEDMPPMVLEILGDSLDLDEDLRPVLETLRGINDRLTGEVGE